MVHLSQTQTEDLANLAVTVGQVKQLIEDGAPAEEWDALTAVLTEERTPEQLASMLCGAAVIIAGAGVKP